MRTVGNRESGTNIISANGQGARPAWTLGDLQRMAREYETVLPDEARELLLGLIAQGTQAVDWREDAESYEPPQAPPWEDSWIVERRLASGRWACVTTVFPCGTEGSAFAAALNSGFRGPDFLRSWRVREVGDLAFARVGGGK